VSAERTEPRPAPRCAYCHDDAASAAAEPCDDCGALVHDECLAIAQGCPTLGCPFAAEPAEERPDPKAASKALPAEPAAGDGELSSLGLVRRAARSDRAPAWWVLVLLAGGVGWWLWTILWPQRFVLDLR
jgi:hypothetical protein